MSYSFLRLCLSQTAEHCDCHPSPDRYLAQALTDPVYEELTSMSHINRENFGEKAYTILTTAMKEAAAKAARDKAVHALQDPPVASAALPAELRSLQALANTDQVGSSL
ncbi:hypothetical protein NMY22_g9760 [Coprinellus aureogranulatus]|nr:hypothetical protein NMY22_g9760 [Coprinellus aureogranulatus]